MREILFRGKTREGKWNESSAVFIRGELALMLTERPIKELVKDKNGELVDVIFNFCAVEKETVGQFTGVTDKNGKKIFEGDIVTGRFLHSLPVNSVITFKDGAFGLLWNRAGAETFDAFTSLCNIEYEVIGNIHDNPELLEVK